MLRSFRVANHRSIRDEQEWLLLPVYGEEQAVPVAAIYGANASGKSNLLDALEFMASAVRDSFRRWSPNGGVPRSPFKLDAAVAAQPSTFVVELVLDGVRYTYGFVVDSSAVRHEWLYSYPEKRRRILFERDGDDVKVGTTVPELDTELDVLRRLTRPNALFLSVAVQSNVAQLLPLYQYFDEMLAFRSGGSVDDLEQVLGVLGSSTGEADRLAGLVRVADVGISDVGIVRHEGDRENHIGFIHGRDSVFTFNEESEGTRSWVRMLPVVLTALDHGRTLVIDEIDTSLHPRLTARLVRLFQELETNPNGAQLVFTTHDTSLLGTMLGDEVLKRDQVWFVEKSPDGLSVLYPLTDFKPRKGENTERRYLGGSYGAVPVLSDQEFADVVRVRDAS